MFGAACKILICFMMISLVQATGFSFFFEYTHSTLLLDIFCNESESTTESTSYVHIYLLQNSTINITLNCLDGSNCTNSTLCENNSTCASIECFHELTGLSIGEDVRIFWDGNKFNLSITNIVTNSESACNFDESSSNNTFLFNGEKCIETECSLAATCSNCSFGLGCGVCALSASSHSMCLPGSIHSLAHLIPFRRCEWSDGESCRVC